MIKDFFVAVKLLIKGINFSYVSARVQSSTVNTLRLSHSY